jgi:hypothetical protein
MSAPVAPPPAPDSVRATARPGHVLGIVGLVLAVIVAPVGLVVSIVAAVRSSRAGWPSIPALVGIPVAGVIMALSVVAALIAVVVWFVAGIECGETAGRSGCL